MSLYPEDRSPDCAMPVRCQCDSDGSCASSGSDHSDCDEPESVYYVPTTPDWSKLECSQFTWLSPHSKDSKYKITCKKEEDPRTSKFPQKVERRKEVKHSKIPKAPQIAGLSSSSR